MMPQSDVSRTGARVALSSNFTAIRPPSVWNSAVCWKGVVRVASAAVGALPTAGIPLAQTLLILTWRVKSQPVAGLECQYVEIVPYELRSHDPCAKTIQLTRMGQK